MSDNSIKTARQATGYNRKEISELLQIPYRTFEDWENGRSSPPKYVELLLLEKLSTMKKNQQS